MFTKLGLTAVALMVGAAILHLLPPTRGAMAITTTLHPALEPAVTIPAIPEIKDGFERFLFRVKDEIEPGSPTLEQFGYAREAANSYRPSLFSGS